jgi:hypothetical protein
VFRDDIDGCVVSKANTPEGRLLVLGGPLPSIFPHMIQNFIRLGVENQKQSLGMLNQYTLCPAYRNILHHLASKSMANLLQTYLNDLYD